MNMSAIVRCLDAAREQLRHAASLRAYNRTYGWDNFISQEAERQAKLQALGWLEKARAIREVSNNGRL